MRAYHDDVGWLADLAGYAGLDREELRDLLGCFFADRAAAEIPDWAKDREDPAFEARRETLCRAHGWSASMPLCKLVHYELMARESYKVALHVEWLEALEILRAPGAPLQVLDYGCGVGSFGNLALSFDEVRCTLADMDPKLVHYLAWKHRDLPERLRVQRLEGDCALPPRAARVPVDSRSISGRYDAIALADVLEHTIDPFRILRQLLARIRPGGIVFVNYPKEIEGDWHTPEAFHLRRGCFLLLRLCARRIRPHTWRMRSHRWRRIVLRVARAANPALYRGAARFARAYFERHGRELAEIVRTRAHRELSLEDLLASVVEWPCGDVGGSGVD